MSESTLSALTSWPLLTDGIGLSISRVVVASRPIIFFRKPSEMTISAIASFRTMIRDVSDIVTDFLSADSTVTGSFEFGLPIIGNSKSADAIMIGRTASTLATDAGVFESVFELVQAEIVGAKQMKQRTTRIANFAVCLKLGRGSDIMT